MAARALQWLLLLISFTAVLRPILTGQIDSGDYEGPGCGFWQPDGADGASSVRGPDFPVWRLLVHFGCIEKRTSRAAKRRIRRVGPHQPAQYLLFSHGMSSTYTPLELITGKLCNFEQCNPRSFVTTFLGVGSYFMILLIACADIESNPGPETFDDQFEKLTTDAERIDALWAENKKLATCISQLFERVTALEEKKRSKNAIIFGIPSEVNLNEAVDNVLFDQLRLTKKCPQNEIIKHATRFGRDGPSRPILVRFKDEVDKEQAVRLAPRLKGSGIFVSEDLSPAKRRERRKIVKACKEAAEKGIATKVQRQGLSVNGQVVPLEALDSDEWMEKFLPPEESKSSVPQNLPISPRAELMIKVSTPMAPVKSRSMSNTELTARKWGKSIQEVREWKRDPSIKRVLALSTDDYSSSGSSESVGSNSD